MKRYALQLKADAYVSHLYRSCNYDKKITPVNNKFFVCVFSADLGQTWCAESKNHIGFAQSGQVFELRPHAVFTFLFTLTLELVILTFTYLWRLCTYRAFLFCKWVRWLQPEDRVKNKPDVFCYICGEYTIVPNWKSGFIRRAYHVNFGKKLGDQDKSCAPHMVCKACIETLRGWTNGKRSLNFGISMVWRDKLCHWLLTRCYWCDWHQQIESEQPQVSWSSISTLSLCSLWWNYSAHLQRTSWH